MIHLLSNLVFESVMSSYLLLERLTYIATYPHMSKVTETVRLFQNLIASLVRAFLFKWFYIGLIIKRVEFV